MQQAIEQLRIFFAEHPAWVKAAKSIVDGANSEVVFDGEAAPWRLMRVDGVSVLEPGVAPSPDFTFYFTGSAIASLTQTDQKATISDFALVLFNRIISDDPRERIGFHVRAPFGQLVKRGYLRVLLRGGPAVLRFMSEHGIRSWRDFNSLVTAVRGDSTFDWARLGREGWHGH